MYIIKNALRCIGRSKGRNILIGIIVLVIAISACIGLSIRQAAESAKMSALEGMGVTATISYDRASAMGNISGGRPGKDSSGFQSGQFDPSQFEDIFKQSSSLTLEEYLKYAESETVEDFYYTITAYFNGSEYFLPVSNESEEDSSSSSNSSFPGGFPGGMGGMGLKISGDFSIIGYSNDSAMKEFVNDNASIVDGSMFEEGTSELICVISEELAMYNNVVVGDSIIVQNPSLNTEAYTLTISGIFTSNDNNDFSMSMFGVSQDPANRIYMSANALQTILDASFTNKEDTKIEGNISATYCFSDTSAYYSFEKEVRKLGLDDSYKVSSSDITAFENSLAPLTTLSKMAGWFLLVILIIGGVILVVLNIFNVRERKYEVGVLTAMGMKKWKVATQFVCEILVITMIAVVIGSSIGAVSSVPVTNVLLEGQVENQNNKQNQINQNFGRPGNMGSGFSGSMPPDLPSDISGSKNPFENMFVGAADYITEVNSAMNITVVLQMIGVGLLLTLIASAASVLFIMRYDPLKILANRD